MNGCSFKEKLVMTGSKCQLFPYQTIYTRPSPLMKRLFLGNTLSNTPNDECLSLTSEKRPCEARLGWHTFQLRPAEYSKKRRQPKLRACFGGKKHVAGHGLGGICVSKILGHCCCCCCCCGGGGGSSGCCCQWQQLECFPTKSS